MLFIAEVRLYDRALSAADVQALANAVASAPPVASWKLDEGAGSTAADASGNGNTATLAGGSSWTPRIVGSVNLMHGDSAQLSVPFSPSLNLAGAFSVAAWVKTD